MTRIRPVQPLPDDVRQDLEEAGVIDAYGTRPFYQRNDYLTWIGRAKRPETRDKFIEQRLDELKTGGVYVGMEHRPIRKR